MNYFELDVWKRSRSLVKTVYTLSQKFPRERSLRSHLTTEKICHFRSFEHRGRMWKKFLKGHLAIPLCGSWFTLRTGNPIVASLRSLLLLRVATQSHSG